MIPFLFPAARQLVSKQYSYNEKVYNMPNHGFGRNMKWGVVNTFTDQSSALITIRLESDKDTLKMYPFNYQAELTYRIEPEQIKIEQTYFNLSKSVMPLATGFHPYLLSHEKEIITNNESDSYYD